MAAEPTPPQWIVETETWRLEAITVDEIDGEYRLTKKGGAVPDQVIACLEAIDLEELRAVLKAGNEVNDAT